MLRKRKKINKREDDAKTQRRINGEFRKKMSCSTAKSSNTEQSEWNPNSLPDDISIKIISFLQIQDVCNLGSCSRFWRELCGSDFIWVSLYRQRWPSLEEFSQPQPQPQQQSSISTESSDFIRRFSSVKGWKSFYILRHHEMADKARAVIEVVNKCSGCKALESGEFHKVIDNLGSMELGFEDVEMFLFTSKQSTLLNLVGLHYSMIWLEVPVDYVMDALLRCHISERQVCVRWWKLGRWFYDFRVRDETYSRKVSLGDLASCKEEEVLGVLNRGAVHEVLRVHISLDGTDYIPWMCQNMRVRN